MCQHLILFLLKSLKGTFQCAECRSLCVDFEEYATHMNSHSTVPLFTCPKCLYMFQDKSLFEAHTSQVCKAAGSSKDKECAVCGKTFKYDSHLREHIICMHNKTPMFSCPICGQNITSWRRSIDRHMSNHANQIKCPTCGLKGESIDVVENHIASSGDGHLQCKACDYTSASRLEFFNHVNVHIPKVDVLEPMVCYKCGQRFQRTSEFNNHVRLFCRFRDTPVAITEAKVCEQPLQMQHSGNITELHQRSNEGSQEVIEIPNDASKQIIALPENANNNTFIPITLTTGGEDLGQGIGPNTTVIIIPQILFMPGQEGQEGMPQIIGSGQNDQVIYLECLKPDQPGMLPIYQVPSDKTTPEGTIYLNHMPQTVVPETEPPVAVENIKQEEESEPVNIKPPTSVAVSASGPLSVQNVYSLALAGAAAGGGDSSNQHVNSGEGPPALVCSVCNEVLRDSETYENHVKQHDKSKTKVKPVLGQHAKRATSFKCEECGQGFMAKHHLEQHTITFHSDVAGIVCPVCRVGMASEKTSLNEHLAKAHKLRVEPSGKLTDCSDN